MACSTAAWPAFRASSLGHCRRSTLWQNLRVKCRGPRRGLHFAQACQSTCTRTLQKKHSMRYFISKMPRNETGDDTGGHTLCEPVQSKSTWTLHKKPFMLEFTGPRPGTTLLREPARSKMAWTLYFARIYMKNGEHPGQAPAFTLPVSSSQWGHTVRGKTIPARAELQGFQG